MLLIPMESCGNNWRSVSNIVLTVVYLLLTCDVFLGAQIDAHMGGVNDIAFSHPNKSLSIITCGDDKTIKVNQ